RNNALNGGAQNPLEPVGQQILFRQLRGQLHDVAIQQRRPRLQILDHGSAVFDVQQPRQENLLIQEQQLLQKRRISLGTKMPQIVSHVVVAHLFLQVGIHVLPETFGSIKDRFDNVAFSGRPTGQDLYSLSLEAFEKLHIGITNWQEVAFARSQ